jgi:hypothetical protein
MPTFQILYFRESVLEHADEVEARDVLEAVTKTVERPNDLRVEIWSEHRRVAQIGPSPLAYAPRPRKPK